jgi:hypothetical protein
LAGTVLDAGGVFVAPNVTCVDVPAIVTLGAMSVFAVISTTAELFPSPILENRVIRACHRLERLDKESRLQC